MGRPKLTQLQDLLPLKVEQLENDAMRDMDSETYYHMMLYLYAHRSRDTKDLLLKRKKIK